MLDHVVLPILEEYKPDIIIILLGRITTIPTLDQYEFFCQGLCHAQFQAKSGYTVLEGGYSIEGALPYVNLGIILAMAGLDFSNVREPDYDEEALQQTKRTTEYIKSCPISYTAGGKIGKAMG